MDRAATGERDQSCIREVERDAQTPHPSNAGNLACLPTLLQVYLFWDFATTAPLHVFSSRDRKGAVVVHPYSFDRIALILASMLSLSTSPAM